MINEQALKDRLQIIAKDKEMPFNACWKQLLLERFLARLARSSHVNKFIFKGGFLSNSQQSLTNAVYVIGETVILWVGTINILNGNLTIGELITFNALLAYFLDPVKNLINLQPTMQTAIVAADRLGEILDLEPEKKEKVDLEVCLTLI